MADNVVTHIPVHFVSGEKTVCSLPVNRQMAMTYNPKLTTCRRCTKTKMWQNALAGIRRQRNSSARFIQPGLFN